MWLNRIVPDSERVVAKKLPMIGVDQVDAGGSVSASDKSHSTSANVWEGVFLQKRLPISHVA
jgi:hypothetical protein